MKKIFLLLTSFVSIFAQEMRWNWAEIDPTQVSFAKDFLWGVAVSEYQISGARHCAASNWAAWEERNKVPRAGAACNHWDSLEETITCIKQLGVKAFRFSVEWSLIEPEKGTFDLTALGRYRDFCRRLKEEGVVPMVTLHHFTHPQWFEELGGFEKLANIRHFVRFSEIVFDALQDYVPFWCTINEPGVYVLQGYIRGVYPPGENNTPFFAPKADRVLYNLCRAHVAVYNALKKRPGGSESQIGIVHNILQFDTYHKNNWLEKMVCRYFNTLMNDAVLGFFDKGVFKKATRLPFDSSKWIYPEAVGTLDFIGLNYYSHVVWNYQQPQGESYREGDIRTDMQYALYPEGLYRAIDTVSVLNVPIYITENGAPDKHDVIREQWTQRYTYAMHKALEDGYDVRGFFYWSLMDNYEWNEGYEMKFGLFEVDFANPLCPKKLRDGARYYVDLVKKTYQ